MAAQLQSFHMSIDTSYKELSAFSPATPCRHYWRTQERIHRLSAAQSRCYSQITDDLPCSARNRPCSRRRLFVLYSSTSFVPRFHHLPNGWYKIIGYIWIYNIYLVPEEVRLPTLNNIKTELNHSWSDVIGGLHSSWFLDNSMQSTLKIYPSIDKDFCLPVPIAVFIVCLSTVQLSTDIRYTWAFLSLQREKSCGVNIDDPCWSTWCTISCNP